MRKIKTFATYVADISDIDTRINDWIMENNVHVLSIKAIKHEGTTAIIVLYEDLKERKQRFEKAKKAIKRKNG